MSNLSNSSSSAEGQADSGPPAKRPREACAERPADAAARLAQQFAVQGVTCDAAEQQLFCAMCQGAAGGARVPLEASAEAVLLHCSGRAHLVAYEQIHAEVLREWCPVELHGHRMLLDHHCVYPRAMFGPGRLLMDDSIANGMLLAEDVCGGVALLPLHRYTVTELALSASRTFTRRRADEEGEADAPAELARCTLEPLASLPSHLRAQLYVRRRVPEVPPEARPQLPVYYDLYTEASGNTHARFDKVLDTANEAITSELARQQRCEKQVSTSGAFQV
ncbi:hypothetical protein STCU_10279 [Strigomonas culicis]|uniref:Uncharacterized protein n=1 Tax=Strigomonas culicis TaxID=28005 RepID=S9V514_9TRYP|nr:hypothetical protein STCU_10279 [Strigomonas culicis]|eukprot:EPY17980.1 hypothetical protein STCU_10279 [Strigomonas culicis]